MPWLVRVVQCRWLPTGYAVARPEAVNWLKRRPQGHSKVCPVLVRAQASLPCGVLTWQGLFVCGGGGAGGGGSRGIYSFSSSSQGFCRVTYVNAMLSLFVGHKNYYTRVLVTLSVTHFDQITTPAWSVLPAQQPAGVVHVGLQKADPQAARMASLAEWVRPTEVSFERR